MKYVLIVCTANVCRSPMVAGLLTHRLDAVGWGDQVVVRSAGIFAEAGRPAWRPISELMVERGIDLGRHRSQPISVEMAMGADLIIVMEEVHRQSIFYLAPRALHKVFLLGELAGDAEPLADVMGRPLQEVAAACEKAEKWLEEGWDQITARLGLPEAMSQQTYLR